MFENRRKFYIDGVTALLILLGATLIYVSSKIIDIILVIFFSYILTVALNPYVEKLEQKSIPRTFAAVMVTIPALFIILTSLALVFKIAADELAIFVRDFPTIFAELFSNSELVAIESAPLASLLQSELREIYALLSDAVLFVMFIIFTLVIVLYMLIDYRNLKQGIINIASFLTPVDVKPIMGGIEQKLGYWVRGQFILMIVIGLMTYLSLSILGVKYALPLALLAGIFEIIPIIGPILAAVPAIIIGFNHSFVTGIIVCLIYFIIQQLEYQFLVPKIMEKAVNQTPLVTLLSVLIGQALFGILGALVAVPAVVIITEIIYNIRIRYLAERKSQS